MPLFTPVLQDFQNKFGSSILERHSNEQDIQHQYDHRDNSPPNFHEQLMSENDDDDDDDDDEHDSESAHRNLLYNRVGKETPGISYSPDSLIAKKPLFGGTRHIASPGPFALSSNEYARDNRSIPRPRPNIDLGTDHEAPASLMIEMNHHDHDQDQNESNGYWNFGSRARERFRYKRPGMNAEELAMWKWVNVENLDNFLARVYDYYVGKGMYTILLERCLNLLTFAFVIGFATFLVGCVNYPRLRHSKHLDEVLIPQCFHRLSTGTFVVLLLFTTFWIGQLIRLIYDIPEMVDMCNFYTYLLQIPDEDIQSVSWQEVVNRIMKIRDNNPNTTTTATIQTTDTQRLDEHNIANRIMRKENFMIAIFNKELIDLSPPVPFLRNRTILTRILEWSLSFCILGYVFDERGQVRKRFLKDSRRDELADGLRRRFQFMGLATVVFSPLISIYLMLYFFFRYFEEYHKNPGSIGTRQYTPIAKWKFKEFNEFPHMFEARINASYPVAMKYINQFPKEKTILVCRFVAFISGSFAAVLALMTLFDQELLLGFEITSEKTVFFYLGLFGTIMAVSRGMIPDQTEIFKPESLLEEVVEHTRYLPDEWRNKLHTDEVRRQFALLFEYSAVLFLLEFMSLILTPLILGLSLPSCSEKLIDFFREFTVHVDGVGYVCSFAVFDFKRHGNVKQHNPDWEPNNPEGSMYFSRILEADARSDQQQSRSNRARDRAQPASGWNQQSNHSRARGVASSYYNPDRSFYHGKSRLGSNAYTRKNHTSDDGNDEDSDIAYNQRRNQGPGVKFFINAKPHSYGHNSGSNSDCDESDSRYGQRQNEPHPSDPLGFTSNLGDSFVSEIGQSMTTADKRSKLSRGGNARGIGEREGEDLSDAEDERESRKKGIFGLLNQIYEMNNVTM
ncbi:autophagy protein atg9 [Entomortierella beljakovae]|nr:autophagy protein atg9 [Entomortierella beljakovae]